MKPKMLGSKSGGRGITVIGAPRRDGEPGLAKRWDTAVDVAIVSGALILYNSAGRVIGGYAKSGYLSFEVN